MKTKVIFYQDTEGDTFAFFPEDKYNSETGLFTSYSHVGQHSACHIDYVKKCELTSDYYDLAQELEENDYDLVIMNEWELEYHRNPTTAEIRFGEGATHYKTFSLEQCLLWMHHGFTLKQWLVCPQDGLRYYR